LNIDNFFQHRIQLTTLTYQDSPVFSFHTKEGKADTLAERKRLLQSCTRDGRKYYQRKSSIKSSVTTQI